jgi:uncharacterized protein YbcV (DUF1398 family)
MIVLAQNVGHNITNTAELLLYTINQNRKILEFLAHLCSYLSHKGTHSKYFACDETVAMIKSRRTTTGGTTYTVVCKRARSSAG